jgi:hypothetical protein
MSLSPTIIAAIIGVGGTVATAISGFVASTKVSAQAVRAGTENTRLIFEAECQHRLWERRAELYAEVLANAAHRAMTREHNLKGFRFAPQAETLIQGVAGFIPGAVVVRLRGAGASVRRECRAGRLHGDTEGGSGDRQGRQPARARHSSPPLWDDPAPRENSRGLAWSFL